MVSLLLVLHLLQALEHESPELTGHIQGVIVNGTRGNERLGSVRVILQAGPRAALAPVAETTSDFYGKFAFNALPLDPSIIYLPGAERDGVHYAGKRLRLDATNPLAQQTITTFDAVESPSPLRATSHDIDISVVGDVAKVNETLIVVNRSLSTYVGQHAADESRTSLRLSVPPNFDRVTFKSEFYGRRFRIMNHQPVTDIPWPPGERELKFAYQIQLEQGAATLHRALDLPSGNVTVRMRGKKPSQLSCNLPVRETRDDKMVFASSDDQLPAGYVVEVQVGAPPIPWRSYARSGSIVALVMLMFATAIVLRRRGAQPSPVE